MDARFVRRRRLALAGAALVPAATLPRLAAAQTRRVDAYPTRPVRLITGSVGSTSDLVARLVGQRLSERWKQSVIVDNRAGLGGAVGGQIAAKAPPDGYTLMVGQTGTHVSPQFLYKNLGYDPVRDFVPIAKLSNAPIALAVHPSLPVTTLKELIAHSREHPGKIMYSSPGGGTSGNLTAELFNQATGAKLMHVPYKGAGFALTAVVAGEVQASFLSTTTIAAQVKAGKLRALAVLSPKRFFATPDIPATGELGFPQLESNVWFGLFAVAGTPKPVLERIYHDTSDIVRTPEYRDALVAQGSEPVPMTQAEFQAFLKREIARWGKVIREAGIQAE
jgi:tripartite-type tricarboxylate transporter receptor subunit TctC